MKKTKIAIIRGAFLNKYEMQFYAPLAKQFDLTGFSSLFPIHDDVGFPVVKLPSPMDLPDVPYKMPVLNRLFTDAQYLFGLENKLAGFDLVHTAETYYRYTQQALNAKKLGLVKYVIATVLENIPFNNEGIHGRKEFKARARNELDHIIALTQKTKDVLIAEGADPEKISIINHYIDTKRFYPEYRKRDPLTVLYCGRLEEYKGVLDILESIQLVSAPMKMIFCGNGSLLKNMQRMERLRGIDGFVQHIQAPYDRMSEIYRLADIFIAPSKPTLTWEEQYNTSLLEAQASGLAIITTRSGGIPENVGDAALIAEPGDVKTIAGMLQSFLTDPALRASYGAKARKRAVEYHDITIGSAKLSALYETILAGKHP